VGSHIYLNRVTVEFPLYGVQRSFKRLLLDRLLGKDPDPHSEIKSVISLDQIDLDIKEGDRVGVLGHNGAGKSTLLKVLAGVYEPITGMVSIQGKVAPLFDITLGMSPDATGYENILTRGLILGLSIKEIRRLTPAIIDFSELGEKIRLPVRTYSSGMLLRLAFSISTAIRPDILLLDEWVSTGDIGFVQKAEARIMECIDHSSILVFASHSLDQIKKVCNKAIIMHKGKIILQGTTEEVLAQYTQSKWALG